jgi:hypothetical protein
MRSIRDPAEAETKYVLCLNFLSLLQIYCLFLFLTGACLFGTLISRLNDILQAVNRKANALENHLDGYISFMSEYR